MYSTSNSEPEHIPTVNPLQAEADVAAIAPATLVYGPYRLSIFGTFADTAFILPVKSIAIILLV